MILQQFDNPANPAVHRRTTAEEIWEATEGDVDVFVAGVGTGGTITGVGEVLKERNKDVTVVAVEPAGAAVLSGRKPSGHYIPGLGAGFVPKVLNRDIIDRVVPVTDAGPSCGAALAAALHLAQKPDYRGKTFVVVLPDSGERYVNNPIFHEMASKIEGR